MVLSEKARAIYKVTDTHVYGFFAEHRFLSNFHLCDVYFEGMVYPSVENAYQAAKTLDQVSRQEFTTMDPSKAKSAGRTLTLREDWHKDLGNPNPHGLVTQLRDQIMWDLNWDKFTRHPALAEKLLETGDKYLEETNWWKDDYWGVCSGTGLNKLGKILMKVRETLREK